MAVVTGCTRGIGAQYCQCLAKLGIDLILIARKKVVAEKQAEELASQYNINTCVIEADFNDVTEKNFQNVFQQLDDKDIGILINNAGIMYECPDYFHNVPDQLLTELSNTNVIWPMKLSHHVIRQKMLQKGKGLVVFMSSAAGKRSTPLLTAYGASKAFIYHLARSMAIEYRGTGVHVQAILPFYVATDMTKYGTVLNKPTLLSPSSETYVRQAIRTFGMTSETAGYLPHAFQGALLYLFPDKLYGFGAFLWQLLIVEKHKD